MEQVILKGQGHPPDRAMLIEEITNDAKEKITFARVDNGYMAYVRHMQVIESYDGVAKTTRFRVHAWDQGWQFVATLDGSEVMDAEQALLFGYRVLSA